MIPNYAIKKPRISYSHEIHGSIDPISYFIIESFFFVIYYAVSSGIFNLPLQYQSSLSIPHILPYHR